VRRELSSTFTPIYRWVIPALLSIAAIVFIWRVAVSNSPGTTEITIVVALAAGCVILARWLDKAKRVWIDEESLLVSDYRREDTIKLVEIDRVTATRWLRPDRVTITFTRPTIFGNKVVFFPARKGFRLAAPHPIARELTESIDRSRQATQR